MLQKRCDVESAAAVSYTSQVKAIGICGPSGSGKTTLAKKLCEEYNGTLLSLDNYFFPDPPVKKYTQPGHNWELPENIDWQAYRDDVQSLKSGEPTAVRKIDWEKETYTKVSIIPKEFIVAEGFLLFYDRELVTLLDLTFYLDVSDETGLKRRLSREQSDENRQWFEEVTFPEYKKHRKVFEAAADVILSGEDPLDAIYKKMKQEIEERYTGFFAHE